MQETKSNEEKLDQAEALQKQEHITLSEACRRLNIPYGHMTDARYKRKFKPLREVKTVIDKQKIHRLSVTEVDERVRQVEALVKSENISFASACTKLGFKYTSMISASIRRKKQKNNTPVIFNPNLNTGTDQPNKPKLVNIHLPPEEKKDVVILMGNPDDIKAILSLAHLEGKKS